VLTPAAPRTAAHLRQVFRRKAPNRRKNKRFRSGKRAKIGAKAAFACKN